MVASGLRLGACTVPTNLRPSGHLQAVPAERACNSVFYCYLNCTKQNVNFKIATITFTMSCTPCTSRVSYNILYSMYI